MNTIQLLERFRTELAECESVARERAEERAGVLLVGATGDPYQCGARDAYEDARQTVDKMLDVLREVGVRA